MSCGEGWRKNVHFTPSEGVAEKQEIRTPSEGVGRTEGGMEECGGRGGQAYCRRAGGMRPRVMAFMTMSAALVAPSLRMMWLRWDSTVFSVM